MSGSLRSRKRPYAFGSTYVRERDYDEQRWRAWVGATDDDGVVFLAYDDGRPVGMDGAFHRDAGAVALIAMWVAPAARRTGVGAALTRAVIDWARSVGAPRVLLGIAEDNDRALSCTSRSASGRRAKAGRCILRCRWS